MLIADKHRLENQTKVKLLAIRETELELYVQNCRQVGFVAAIIGGLAYFSFLYTKRDYYQEAHWFARVLYVTGLTCTMSLALTIVLATTTIAMLGPGLALRGPDGSMNTAVDGILLEFELASRLFSRCVQAVSPPPLPWLLHSSSHRPPLAALSHRSSVLR